MIASFFETLFADLSNPLIGRVSQISEHQIVPGIKAELASHGATEILIWLFEQKTVPEVASIAKESEHVWRPLLSFQFRGVSQPVLCLAVQVQRDVSHCHVLFKLRSTPTPFTQALAQDEAIVSETKNELEAMVGLKG